MIKQYKYTVISRLKNNKTLVQNFSYLSTLQGINLLIPLLTYPYLIRVLGKEVYGLVVFAQAIVNYLLILVSFGFNISATKQISVHRDDKAKVSEIVCSTLIIKSVLFVVSLIILGVLLFTIPGARGSEVLFLLSMSACLNDVLFPVWYFQGIERMKYITYITLISRLTFLLFIFILIKNPADYLWVPSIYGIGYLLAGLTALYIVFYRNRIKFRFQSFAILKKYFTDSVPIFISNVSISIYVSTNKVIVGAFLGMGEVAYYDLAEKITSLLKIPQQIVSQTIFPKISKEQNPLFVKKIFRVSRLINIGLLILILILGKYAILLLGGEQMLPAKIVMNILAITIPVIGMSNIFAINMLIPFGYNKIFSRIIITSGILYAILMIIIGSLFHFTLVDVAVTNVITEIFVTSYSYYYCKKIGLWK